MSESRALKVWDPIYDFWPWAVAPKSCTPKVRASKNKLALTQMKIWLQIIWVSEKVTKPELGRKEALG